MCSWSRWFRWAGKLAFVLYVNDVVSVKIRRLIPIELEVYRATSGHVGLIVFLGDDFWADDLRCSKARQFGHGDLWHSQPWERASSKGIGKADTTTTRVFGRIRNVLPLLVIFFVDRAYSGLGIQVLRGIGKHRCGEGNSAQGQYPFISSHKT